MRVPKTRREKSRYRMQKSLNIVEFVSNCRKKTAQNGYSNGFAKYHLVTRAIFCLLRTRLCERYVHGSR